MTNPRGARAARGSPSFGRVKLAGGGRISYICNVRLHCVMFEPTIPFGEPELMRVSTFRRYLEELDRDPAIGASSRLASLSPSLMADLMRFEHHGNGSEALEVLAACVRHARNVTVHVALAEKVVPLTVFAQERLVHCPVGMDVLLEGRLAELRVMHVEPATLRPPGDGESALVGAAAAHFPLGRLLWELALRGSRDKLLPEIAGTAAYRLSPSLELEALPLAGSMLAAVERLARQPTTLRELSDWPGFDRERAARLLNALYLQSGLIISRAHPAALGDSWFSALGR